MTIETIAGRAVKRRTRLKLTQSDVYLAMVQEGRRLGIAPPSSSWLAQLERDGSQAPGGTFVMLLAIVLDVTTDWLLTGIGKMSRS